MYNCGSKLEEVCDRMEGSLMETDVCEDEDWESKYVIVGLCGLGSERKKEKHGMVREDLGELIGSDLDSMCVRGPKCESGR